MMTDLSEAVRPIHGEAEAEADAAISNPGDYDVVELNDSLEDPEYDPEDELLQFGVWMLRQKRSEIRAIEVEAFTRDVPNGHRGGKRADIVLHATHIRFDRPRTLIWYVTILYELDSIVGVVPSSAAAFRPKGRVKFAHSLHFQNNERVVTELFAEFKNQPIAT